MGKLHELLAVEGQLDGAAKKILDETKTTLSKKEEHFHGFIRRYEPYQDGIENQLPSEEKELTTTVSAKLDYMFGSVNEWLDAVLQKERTNQDAKADIVIDGVVLVEGVPATFLLGLESKLKELRDVLEAIPTLPPGIRWELDAQKGTDIYRAVNVPERIRTLKVTKPVVLYEATKEHPAQVKEFTEDVAVGRYVETHWSGMISPAEKSALLGRVDTLLRAVKQARQRANNTEVVPVKIGGILSGYILGN